MSRSAYMAQFKGYRPPRPWRRAVRLPADHLAHVREEHRTRATTRPPLTYAERRELMWRLRAWQVGNFYC